MVSIVRNDEANTGYPLLQADGSGQKLGPVDREGSRSAHPFYKDTQ